MLYRLTTFDGLTLPTAIGAGQLSVSAPAGTDYIALPDWRTYDALRSTTARPSSMRYTMDCIIEAANSAALKTAYDTLKAKDGVRGTLTRSDDASATHTVTARLTVPETTVRPENIRFLRLSLAFECEWPWVGTSRAGNVTVTGSEGAQTIANGGNAPYLTPVFTLTAGTGSVTAFTFTAGPDAAGRKWQWNYGSPGTAIAAGTALVVDCGAGTVKRAGVDAYNGFSLGATHNTNEWAIVPNGGLTFAVTVTHGGTDPVLAWTAYDGWHA